MSSILSPDAFYEAVIVGAGPVGLALATALLNHGVPASSILLLDRRRDFTPESESRASLVNPNSMGHIEKWLDNPQVEKHLNPEGHRSVKKTLAYNAPFNGKDTQSVTDELLKRAHITRRVFYSERDFSAGTNPMLCADVSAIKGTKYPFCTSIAQGFIERAIAARLTTLGGKVQREWKVVNVDYSPIEKQGKVKLTLQWLGEGRKAKNQMDIFAGLIVGADGGNSVVRREAGIIAEGHAWDGDFLVADVKTKDPDWPFESRYLGTFEKGIMPTTSEHGLATMIPMPGGIFRIVGSLHNFQRQDMVIENYESVEAATSEPSQVATAGGKAPVTKEMLQQILDQRGPDMSKYKPVHEDDIDRPSEITQVLWASVYKIQSRIASSMFASEKRTAIIGDAAHQHSPAGGQGLNSGLVDAFSLAKTILPHLQKTSPSLARDEGWLHASSDIAAWAERRRPQVIAVANFANRLGRMGLIRGSWANWLRNLVIRALGPWLAPKMAYGLSGLRQTV